LQDVWNITLASNVLSEISSEIRQLPSYYKKKSYYFYLWRWQFKEVFTKKVMKF